MAESSNTQSNKQKIRILISNTTNPWFNLATEDWIFRDLNPDTATLFLWRNNNTVVIGQNQNPWVECKVDKMEQDKIFLARRQSGGGAVFQDLGNTNFTFLNSKQNYQQEANFNIIINALARFNIIAEKSGRNDITVKTQSDDGEIINKKISGCAFKHTPSLSFHHGTLLINTDMQKLANYLNPNPLKLKAKGISSVKSRVANLVEFNPNINHENLSQAICEEFCKHYNASCEIEILDENTLAKIENLNKFYQKMSDWNWRFGNTPEFSHHIETRFDWGILDWHINVEHGIILESKLFSDALDTNLIEKLEQSIKGCRYQKNLLNDLFNVSAEHENFNQFKDVQNWISQNWD